MVIGNLEGVLADTGTSTKCPPPDTRPRGAPAPAGYAARARPPAVRPPGCYAFLTPTHLAPRLREAGFTHLGLANNHAHDYGLDGRSSTERTLSALGLTLVRTAGTHRHRHAASRATASRSSASSGSRRIRTPTTCSTFRAASRSWTRFAGWRISSWSPSTAAPREWTPTRVGPGPEFLGKEPRGDLRAWAHAVVDAGADLVIGHGPHVLRGMEWYRGRLIAYSLGNFATYRGFSLSGPLGHHRRVPTRARERRPRDRCAPGSHAPGAAPGPAARRHRDRRRTGERAFGAGLRG